ncbi:hypothetical protein OH76DRAFT_55691 [Lentinus brumalis]|uniref:Uncharacterized protein n=1 Tax=Lentinus brumalis TaxID=2498619 RepID=A0A371DYE0_9APHY|nr:hypothetical protein OH76DRAFT_55691 [Polyporus brumalis]
MVSSTALVEPSLPRPHPFARADSVASSSHSVASTSAAGLHRRSRTRTRSLAPGKRGRSVGHSGSSSKYGSDAGESFLDLDDAPPVPTLVHAEPEEMTPMEKQQVKKTRRRSRTIGPETRPPPEGLHPGMPPMARSWSALDVREPPSEQGRERQAKSDNGSLKGAKARLRGLSLPRQSFRQNSPSDCSSQPSPQTPYGFGDALPMHTAAGMVRNPRDSMMTQNSGTSSSVYPASTSAGTRTETESSMPYTDYQHEADMSFPDIVTLEHPDFDADDVSYRLRLLLNNSYFLPPAHAKPTPNALSPNSQDLSKKAKAGNAGFLDFFRIGKSKSKPTSPVPGSPPPIDTTAPILRTTSDTPTASGFLPRVQQLPLAAPVVPQPPPPPASRVVVLRERMDDLETAAKEAEKDLRRADPRKTKSQTNLRDRFVDDVIDPTDAVDLPPPSADSIFAVQASAVYGLGPQDSVGAAVLAEVLVPNSPGIWSINSEEDSWRKELLREAVSHSLGNTPNHSFSSIPSHPAQPPASPPQSEATFPTPAMLQAQQPKIGQRILDNMSIRTESSVSPPQSPLDGQFKSSMSLRERSSKVIEHPMMTAAAPARAETPAHMPLPLAPAPRKQLVNPLYSLSQPDLPEAGKSDGPSAGSSTASYHTVRKATSTPGLSGAEDVQRERAMLSLSPPPLPEYQSSKRGISPDSRDLAGMPSFSTGRSRTESDSRYSSDSMSFRTPMDTDVDQTGARPSMTMSLPSGRPSISVSVSEYSMPSPTASAFRDGVFGSCRPPSVMSRRSVASHPEPLATEGPMPPLPATGTTPPPRLSSSVRPTELPIPPRPPAVRPTYRPSTSSNNSRTSGSRSGPSSGSPVVSEHSPRDSSFSSSPSSPSAPLAARRGLGSPLSLSIPGQYQPADIHSAPAPAATTDFFDQIQSIHNAMDDLDTSDESESEDEMSLDDANARSRYNHGPPGDSPSLQSSAPSIRSVPEHIEVTRVFVEPRTQAISNRASSSSARPSIMRLGNHSTPQLSPVSHFSPKEPMPQFTYDRKKPIGNVVDLGRRSFSSSRFKSKGKGIANVPNSPLLPIGPIPSSPIAPGTSFGRASVSSANSAAAASSGRSKQSAVRRPATATGAEGSDRLAPGGRKVQRESIQRFDGMLMQHLAAERDRMKRITNDYLTSSATSSPVTARSSSQFPVGRS